MSGFTGRFLTRDPIGYEGSEWDLYEYCRSSPFSGLDPGGLSELDADPASEAGAAWCDTSLDNNAKVQRVVNMGRTDPQVFRAECKCTCCEDDKFNDDRRNECSEKIACRVTVRLQIQIDKDAWDKSKWPGSLMRLFRNLGRVYGHEQLHVRNLLSIAKKVNDELTTIETAVGCTDPANCALKAAEAAKNANAKLARGLVDELHPRATPPLDSTPYDPVGGVFPAKSDCTKPTKVNPFTKRRCGKSDAE